MHDLICTLPIGLLIVAHTTTKKILREERFDLKWITTLFLFLFSIQRVIRAIDVLVLSTIKETLIITIRLIATVSIICFIMKISCIFRIITFGYHIFNILKLF